MSAVVYVVVAFAGVGYRCPPALLPNVRDVSHVLAFHKLAKVLLYQEASRLTAAASANANSTFLVLDFDDNSGHVGDTPRGSALAVFRKTRHRVRDWRKVRLLAHDPKQDYR